MKRRTAFTLVELLVVLAIVGVLVAMVIPSLSRAKDRVRVIQCQANMRSSAQLMATYGNDNRGQYMKTSWEAASELLGTAGVTMVNGYLPGKNTATFRCPGSNLPKFTLAASGYYNLATPTINMPGLQTHYRVVAGRNNYGTADGLGTSARADGGENDPNNYGWLYTGVRQSDIQATPGVTKPCRPIVSEKHALLVGPWQAIMMQDIYEYNGGASVWRGYYGGNWGLASHIGQTGACWGLNSSYFDGHVAWVPNEKVVSTKYYSVAYYVRIYYFF